MYIEAFNCPNQKEKQINSFPNTSKSVTRHRQTQTSIVHVTDLGLTDLTAGNLFCIIEVEALSCTFPQVILLHELLYRVCILISDFQRGAFHI